MPMGNLCRAVSSEPELVTALPTHHNQYQSRTKHRGLGQRQQATRKRKCCTNQLCICSMGGGQGSFWPPPSHVPGTQSSTGRVRSGRHQQGSSSSGAAARDRTGSQRPSTIGPRGLTSGTLRHWGVRTGIQSSAQNCCPHRGPTCDPWGPALPCLSKLSSSPQHPFFSGVGFYDDHAWCLTLFKQ